MSAKTFGRREFADPQALASGFADWSADLLARAIAERGVALLIVSGGNTPKRFLGELSRRDIDWRRVGVTLADERRVSEDNPRSNARMVRATLLQNRAAAAQFAPLADSRLDPEQELASASARVARLSLPADLVILGMGDDGHTASWFPGGDNLAEAMDISVRKLVLPMSAPDAPEPRLTLTARVILRARALALHIEGAEKLAVLDRALRDGPAAEMPIRCVLREAADRLTLFATPPHAPGEQTQAAELSAPA